MTKIACLVEDNYQELELWYPYYRLREGGFETVLVGSGEKKEYFSKKGYQAKEDISITHVSSKEFAGVVIPGGYAPDILRTIRPVNSFVRELFLAQKLVAAICHGPSVLISAGVLKGKNATCFPSIRDDIINAGAEFIDREVVVDENIITSRTPEDLPAFCREIINFLEKSKGD